MGKFLVVFLPLAMLTTGCLWLLLQTVGVDQVTNKKVVDVINIAPFIVGPLMSALFAASLLLVAARKKSN